MIGNITDEVLVTPSEAATLFNEFGTVNDIYRAKDVYKAHLELTKDETDAHWRSLCALSAVYLAGRIQGIREERRKKQR